MIANPPRMTSLFEPKCVAVIGASTNPDKIGHRVLANIVAGGYAGKVIPVNPRGGEVLSLPVYPELTAEQVDRIADAVMVFLERNAEIRAEETVGHEL